MKKLLVAVVLTVMISGCTKSASTRRNILDSNKLPFGAGHFTWENHEYLWFGQGGLIHSESCKCKTNNNLTTAKDNETNTNRGVD